MSCVSGTSSDSAYLYMVQDDQATCVRGRHVTVTVVPSLCWRTISEIVATPRNTVRNRNSRNCKPSSLRAPRWCMPEPLVSGHGTFVWEAAALLCRRGLSAALVGDCAAQTDPWCPVQKSLACALAGPWPLEEFLVPAPWPPPTRPPPQHPEQFNACAEGERGVSHARDSATRAVRSLTWQSGVRAAPHHFRLISRKVGGGGGGG